MHRVQILILSGLVLACLAEDMTKQTKSDSKDNSGHKDASATHKSAMEHEMSHAMTNHSASDAGKTPDKPKNDESLEAKNESMKSSATIGLGFYGGVVPVGYPSYSGYPYYRSYYGRPYWGHPWYQRHYNPWFRNRPWRPW